MPWQEGDALTPTNLNASSGSWAFNVLESGATSSSTVDSTAAFQRALNNAAAAGGGLVLVPAGSYIISSLTVGRNTTLRGAAGGRNLGATNPTILNQTSSAATTMIVLGDTGGTGAVLEDLGLFSGWANNLGGVNIAGMAFCQLNRVSISGMSSYCIQIVGGADTNFNAITDCALTMNNSVGTVVNVSCNSTVGMDSSPLMTGCYVSTNGMSVAWISVQSVSGGISPESPMFTNNRMISSSSVTALYGLMANARFIVNRFETVGSNAVMTVRLAPPTGTQPAGFFLSNTYGAPSGLTWIDSLATTSPRMFESETNSDPLNTFGVRSTTGFATGPSFTFASETSLGLYRSAASTIALSYGALDLRSGALSVRSTNASATSATLNDGEFRVAAVSATSAELAYRSGNTTYRFIAAATAL